MQEEKTLLARKQRRSKELIGTQQLVALIAVQEKPMGEFDERLFDLAVKEIRISKEHDVTFCLHNGLELTEKEGGNKDAVAHAGRI